MKSIVRHLWGRGDLLPTQSYTVTEDTKGTLRSTGWGTCCPHSPTLLPRTPKGHWDQQAGGPAAHIVLHCYKGHQRDTEINRLGDLLPTQSYTVTKDTKGTLRSTGWGTCCPHSPTLLPRTPKGHWDQQAGGPAAHTVLHCYQGHQRDTEINRLGDLLPTQSYTVTKDTTGTLRSTGWGTCCPPNPPKEWDGNSPSQQNFAHIKTPW